MTGFRLPWLKSLVIFFTLFLPASVKLSNRTVWFNIRRVLLAFFTCLVRISSETSAGHFEAFISYTQFWSRMQWLIRSKRTRLFPLRRRLSLSKWAANRHMQVYTFISFAWRSIVKQPPLVCPLNALWQPTCVFAVPHDLCHVFESVALSLTLKCPSARRYSLWNLDTGVSEQQGNSTAYIGVFLFIDFYLFEALVVHHFHFGIIPYFYDILYLLFVIWETSPLGHCLYGFVEYLMMAVQFGRNM